MESAKGLGDPVRETKATPNDFVLISEFKENQTSRLTTKKENARLEKPVMKEILESPNRDKFPKRRRQRVSQDLSGCQGH